MAKYKNRMKETLRKRTKARSSENRFGHTLQLPEDSSIEFFKVKETKYMLDVIPYIVTATNHPDGCEKNELWTNRSYYVHRNVGSNNDTYVCPNKTFGKPCPICEFAAKRRNNGAAKEELRELQPKQRDLFHVIDLNDDPKKVMLWDVSTFLFTKALDQQVADEDDADFCYADLQDGKTLKIRFEKKNFGGREFFETNRIDFVDRKKGYKDSILDQTVPLDDIIVCPSYKELEAAFFMDGEGSGLDDDEDEDEPKSRRPISRRAEDDDDEEEDAKPARKRPVEDDEEDEEETPKPSRKKPVKEEDEEDEEEEETPKPKSKRRPEPEDEDDEEEEKPRRKSKKVEDDEEEDEEEKPRRKPKKSSDDEDEEEEETPKPKGKCPFGLKFGKDCDTDDKCEDCDMWSKCHKAANN